MMFTLLVATSSFAQRQKGDRDKETMRKEFLEFKLDFLSKEIGLKDDQKKQFDDLYTLMETERRAIFKKIKNAEKSVSDKNSSEADYEKASKEIATGKSEMAQLEKRYDEKFATFLTKKQLFKLKEAESKFQQKMQECREKKRLEKKEKR